MLLLFETAAGFALFKVLKESKLRDEQVRLGQRGRLAVGRQINSSTRLQNEERQALVQNLWEDFQSIDTAEKVVKLKHFQKFDNTTDALAAASALVDSKLSKGLKKLLKKHAVGETLAVLDSKLGNIVKEKMGIDCVYSSSVLELARGVRTQLNGLISGLAGHDLTPMSLGLSHSLSRYKLKFSPDKVDTMIVQAIGLLDDLDKELNTYAMRVREWYGWHFPEMTRIVADNVQYARAIKLMGTREKAVDVDFSTISMEEEVESSLKEAAVISMGTEVSEADMLNIVALCDQVISLADYRAQLSEYLRNRMIAIAPNLTILVGELVGARLIAHAGSLVNLAKQPASTVQILGAEKALFRALKTKHETPKYGLIYHASLIGQAPPKYKGKIARVLAAKCSLSTRFDALGEATDAEIGTMNRAKVEARLRQLEGKALASGAAQLGQRASQAVYNPQAQGASAAIATTSKSYNPSADVTTTGSLDKKEKKAKRKVEAVEELANGGEEQPVKKKKKKEKVAEPTMNGGDDILAAASTETEGKKKKKKKKKDVTVEA